MAPFRTAFNGYAVKFSPFEEGRVAVATAQNFGIIGNGRQYVLQVSPICSSTRAPTSHVEGRVDSSMTLHDFGSR